MKVIVAGISKTGTKTLNAALSALGYNVYDFMEHFWEHGKYWEQILSNGCTGEDFREMYRNVDAVVDVPASAFWEDIHKAFPDAKIILTIRDEEEWYRSLSDQWKISNNLPFIYKLIGTLSPTAREFMKHVRLYQPFCFGIQIDSSWKIAPNKTILISRYRQHNCYVIKNAPNEKLLIYKVQEGWGPLCKFLEKDIPEISFPWRNKKSADIQPMIERHPYSKQVKKELLLVFSVFVIIISIAAMFCVYL